MAHGLNINNEDEVEIKFGVPNMVHTNNGPNRDYKNDFFGYMESFQDHLFYVVGLKNDMNPKANGTWVKYNSQ